MSERHPWRLCPLGSHWVREHKRKVKVSAQNPTGFTSVEAHCRKNASKFDQLYRDEMQEIASRYFDKVKVKPCSKMYKFYKKPNVDLFIAGWTAYWNGVFKPEVPLDPNFVKALIASESSFRADIDRLDGKGQGQAIGLMQVTEATLKTLRNEKGELKDHYITLTKEDLKDPSLNISAGIRWLFQKRKLAESREGKKVTWLKTIEYYKGIRKVSPEDRKKILDQFSEHYESFKACK